MPQDWIYGLLGGLMIGCAAALYLLGIGRIMGASGILGGLFQPERFEQRKERLAFIAGLVGLPAVVFYGLGSELDTQATTSAPMLIAAGLLVGFGTRLGNGCTSGHGVCGLSRLSPRGIIATCTFIVAGVTTVVIARLIGGTL